jgi:hypothetical protein
MKLKLSHFRTKAIGLFTFNKNTLVNSSQSNGVINKITEMAVQDSADYAIKNFPEALIFDKRENLWDYCITLAINSVCENPLIVEFGVWKGDSLNYFARKLPSARVLGFDSFEGLEEDWTGTSLPKGYFHMNREVPKFEKNVEIYQGYFEETVPELIGELKDSQIQILHMDADTYKPTAYVLNSLSKNLKTGSIIIFDEFFGYPNFRSHEFKAWESFVTSRTLAFRCLGFTDKQIAVVLL